jgi:cyclopropane fatty-acyl-phospholipid synthase-like methyltransferase
MYVTDVFKNEGSEDFDWEAYFSPEHADKIIQQVDPLQIIANLRKHLQENKFRLTFTLSKLLRKLLAGEEVKSPNILELGAATGLLTRWLVCRYGGTGVLVDKSEASYKKYCEIKDNIKRYLTYITEDIFALELAEEFDLVCSFGLVEHFVDKRDVLAVHRKFVSSRGIIVLLVPLDSPLTRAFLEVHPELNLGYRELLTESEFKKMLTQNGLKVVRTEVSKGYCYDFVGALCRTG